MKLTFTKMHGAGNDFVVIDAIHQQVDLSPAQRAHIADRRFGVGADQILVVENATTPGVDFRYRIYNADGGEVEQCGNGARAFVQFVIEKGLTDKRCVRVETMSGIIELSMLDDGRITVNMGAPRLAPEQLPFDTSGLSPVDVNGKTLQVALVSMGNPHAVQIVEDVDQALVATDGPVIESHPRFPKRVNAGFMQVLSRQHIRLRVYERGAGETLACGTGACAAVVAGIQCGLLNSPVRVDMRGGELTIAWAGDSAPVMLSGPAVTVFEGEIKL